jgi:hypothetical protein
VQDGRNHTLLCKQSVPRAILIVRRTIIWNNGLRFAKSGSTAKLNRARGESRDHFYETNPIFLADATPF